jgi:hypothetical protein
MSSRATPFLAVGAFLWATAGAQSPPSSGPRNLSIPAEPLANALNDLAQQSGLQVMFPSELVARLRSPEVKGSLTAAEALQRLLSNTGLRFEFVNPHTITIVGPAPSPAGNDTKPATPSGDSSPRSDTDGSKNPSGSSRRHHASTKLDRPHTGTVRGLWRRFACHGRLRSRHRRCRPRGHGADRARGGDRDRAQAR